MTIYLLINEQDTDGGSGSNVKVFLSREAARAAMEVDFRESLKDWEFDPEVQEEEHECYCGENEAEIREDPDFESWRIEERRLDVRVAVEIKGGMAQNIYANADVDAEVYDLDVSDCPDEGEQEDTDRKEAELQELVKSPSWQNVW